jgi:uncharacterized protein (TIGR02301 family)
LAPINGGMRRLLLIALLLAAPEMASAADANPPRTPEERQRLVDLAYALGESHSFRLTCNGVDDQTWRARMNSLLTIEAPGADFKRRLVGSFNAGFNARQTQYPICTDEALEGERASAAKGAGIARRLAGRAQ